MGVWITKACPPSVCFRELRTPRAVSYWHSQMARTEQHSLLAALPRKRQIGSGKRMSLFKQLVSREIPAGSELGYDVCV
jgi:hypothetical protein